MNSEALTLMISAFTIVISITAYFFWKVLTTPTDRHKGVKDA
jgi:hypothetical protein